MMLGVFGLDPFAEECVEQVDGGGGCRGPGGQGEYEAGAIVAAFGQEQKPVARVAIDAWP
jgi:hypothetical protein